MNKSISYISIDDDFLDSISLNELLKTYPIVRSSGTFDNPLVALEFIKANSPDLIFMDIDMPDISGIELVRKIKDTDAMVVFVTSHPEYALEGFELSAIDYVLKPATAERLAIAMKRVLELWEMKQQAAAYKVLFEQDSLMIKDGHYSLRIPLHEIFYLEAMQDYTKLVTRSKDYLTLATMSSFVERLPESRFVRIHRSFIVALDQVTEHAPLQVVCAGRTLPVGKTYRAHVKNLFQ